MNKKILFNELKYLSRVNQFVQSIATVVALGYVLTMPPSAFETIE
jgi:hypothetical protein